MRRALLPVSCALLQLVSLSTGAAHVYPRWVLLISDLVGVAAGLSLFARHRAPRLVFVAAVAGYLIQVPLGGPVLPLAVAVATYGVARRAVSVEGDQETSTASTLMTVAVALGGVSVAVALSGHPDLAGLYGLLVLVASLTGILRAVTASRETQRQHDLLAAERLRIARDLHDIVGHGLGAITVQAGAARMAVASGAAADATQALLLIEATGRGVLQEVRWLVGLMRDDSEHAALADVPALVDSARRSGVDVALTVGGDPASVPPRSGEAAYRIVQEALTNVLRHAGQRGAQVTVRIADDLYVDIVDAGDPNAKSSADGDAATSRFRVGNFRAGNGVRGMRERAAAVGGSVEIGPGRDGAGWAVRARLPLSRERR